MLEKIRDYVKQQPGVTFAELYRDIPECRGNHTLMYGPPEDNLILWSLLSLEAVEALRSLVSAGDLEAWVAFPDLYAIDGFKLDGYYVQESLKPRKATVAWVPVLFSTKNWRPAHWCRDIRLDGERFTHLEEAPDRPAHVPAPKKDKPWRRDGAAGEPDYWVGDEGQPPKRHDGAWLDRYSFVGPEKN